MVRDIAVTNKETAEGLRTVVEVLKFQFPKKAQTDPTDLKGVKPYYFG